jgi:S-formylglutathione hydrolase FrmB
MKRIILFLIVIFSTVFLSAQQVETVVVKATKMNKNINNTVVKPIDYTVATKYPVVYLLHGYGGNYQDWINIVPQIKQYATLHQLIIVCPDGANSWYIDSPVNSTSQYESYIVQDLVSYIDKNYSTIADKNARDIIGLSMGGHGALYLAIRNKTVFGTAGSMSGGVDLTYNPDAWDKAAVLGSYASNTQRWLDYSVVTQAQMLQSGDLNIYIDCGINDFFFGVNQNLHDILVAKKINHVYTIYPGEHTWTYWANSIKYQLLFFKSTFEEKMNSWTPNGQLLFHDSSTDDLYDPSWTFATTPSTLPEMTGKFKVEPTIKKAGANSLRLKWKSVATGDWGACIAASGWAEKDLNKALEIRFWIYSVEGIDKALLPSVSLQNSSYASTAKLKLSNYLSNNLAPSTWTEIVIPVVDIKTASPTYNLKSTKSLFFNQDATDGAEHCIYIDEITLPNDPNYLPPATMVLFDNSANNSYFDQSWINSVAPSTVLQAVGYATKIPVVTDIKKDGANGLKLTWTSAVGGNWDAIIASIGWQSFDLTDMTSLKFWVNTPTIISKVDLPKISMETTTNVRSGKVEMSLYSDDIQANTWTQITIPLADIWAADASFTGKNIIKGVFFHQGTTDNMSHTFYIDEMTFNSSTDTKIVSVSANSQTISAYYHAGFIQISNFEGKFQILSVSGIQLFSGVISKMQKGYKIDLQKGMYVIKTEKENTRLLVN